MQSRRREPPAGALEGACDRFSADGAPISLASAGSSVVVADVSEERNEETARLVERIGGRARAVRCDVTRADDVRSALNVTAS